MVLVNIKWSKTRRIGSQVTMLLLKGKGPACPVAALKKLFLMVSALPSDPLLTFHRTKAYSQSRLSILTYSSLMLCLQHWLEQVGYQPFVYSCHSLCSSSASCFCKKHPGRPYQVFRWLEEWILSAGPNGLWAIIFPYTTWAMWFNSFLINLTISLELLILQ